MSMCYISGKSSNKIVHTTGCRYVKMIPAKNRRYFDSPEAASAAGYTRCRYCSRIMKHLRKESKELKRFCGANGLYYGFNASDGSLDVLSPSGKWKVIVNGGKHLIWLYHINTHEDNRESLVRGYHSQKIRSETLLGYMDYIVKHDRFRKETPLYEFQRHGNTVKGSKKWKKEQKRAKQMRKKQQVRYVMRLFDEISV